MEQLARRQVLEVNFIPARNSVFRYRPRVREMLTMFLGVSCVSRRNPDHWFSVGGAGGARGKRGNERPAAMSTNVTATSLFVARLTGGEQQRWTDTRGGVVGRSINL